MPVAEAQAQISLPDFQLVAVADFPMSALFGGVPLKRDSVIGNMEQQINSAWDLMLKP